MANGSLVRNEMVLQLRNFLEGSGLLGGGKEEKLLVGAGGRGMLKVPPSYNNFRNPCR